MSRNDSKNIEKLEAKLSNLQELVEQASRDMNKLGAELDLYADPEDFETMARVRDKTSRYHKVCADFANLNAEMARLEKQLYRLV